MGAGPLQQPLLAGDPPATTPTAPPLSPEQPSLVIRQTAYAAASAPPSAGTAVGYPPYEAQLRDAAAGGAYPSVYSIGSTPPPPPQHYQQQQQQQQQQHHHQHQPAHAPYAPPVVERTIFYEGPVIQRVSAAPVLQICPACGHTGPTRVRRERGCCTWLQCFGLCWLFCPLFWLPCCLDCSRDRPHNALLTAVAMAAAANWASAAAVDRP
ncbi:hypothetical protein MNEG_4898 [Monoraphidium neglectum]|uniref:LITAF domain-containing protein n=1 Tax=Monoraphidium neglectum TaxID=145388 RepID=A0A0D2MJ75_9CHLO|nr:hypothetical protein MNEG_4898 [Monoraphidium neglectum]KIZ03065.1 hypothetical protein MNEG_4898 [Monoraphidium neglectum]|eukprot:XP_013902084.1 hypothetical protein MNEG_4898 [Monoraphidium neglectum]